MVEPIRFGLSHYYICVAYLLMVPQIAVNQLDIHALCFRLATVLLNESIIGKAK